MSCPALLWAVNQTTERPADKLILMGLADPGTRNDRLNSAAFALGRKGCPEDDAEALCRRAARLCGLDSEETDTTFRSGYAAGAGSAPKAGGGSGGNLPCIQTNCRQLREVVSDSWSALHKANAGPTVFLLTRTAMSLSAWPTSADILGPPARPPPPR